MADYRVNGWYVVEVPVTETRSLTGKLLRVIEGKDGQDVLMFRGRQPFAVVSDEIVSIEETTQPKTGVPKHLQD